MTAAQQESQSVVELILLKGRAPEAFAVIEKLVNERDGWQQAHDQVRLSTSEQILELRRENEQHKRQGELADWLREENAKARDVAIARVDELEIANDAARQAIEDALLFDPNDTENMRKVLQSYWSGKR